MSVFLAAPFSPASLVAFVLLISTPASAKITLVGNPSSDGALAPALAEIPVDGSIVMSWLEKQGDGHALKFSVFRKGNFSRPGEIARGSDWFANWADTPAVYPRNNNRWLAHWLEKSASSTYAYDIRLVHTTDGGQNWSVPASPHTDGTPTEHGFVSYFPAGDQRTGMVWLDGRETLAGGHARHEHSGPMTLRTAEIEADGNPEPDYLIDGRVCDCCNTASAMTALGPIVAYRDRSKDEIRDIALVRQTEHGWSQPLIVHPDGWKISGCPVNGPSLIADDMQVVVAWFTMAGGEPKVRFARSSDAGVSFGPPVTRSTGTALGRVQLAWVDNGFVLGWMDHGDDGGSFKIARYSPDGALLKDLTLTGLDPGRISGFPRMAAVNGDLLLAWTASVAEKSTRVMTALVDLDRTDN